MVCSKQWRLVPVAAALLTALSAQAATDDKGAMIGYVGADLLSPNTSNTSDPFRWRMVDGQLFNGVSMDGVARLRFDNDGNLNNGSYVCSGTLLAGGQYVLTAAHCADDFNVMEISFGVYGNVAKETRSASTAYVHSGWNGSLGTGADIAVIKLDAPVVGIQGFNLSTSNDVGKSMLITGYGSTTTGDSTTRSNWGDWGWGHWGYNVADVSVQTFDTAVYGPNNWEYFGEEYLFDFDNGLPGNNALGMLAELTGNVWSSDTGRANEALIAGGDSGGADFVWNGSEWLISGVHSYGYFSFCTSFGITPNCDVSTGANGAGGNWGNTTSYGDVSGSTAVYSHAAWVSQVTAVPEPSTYAMLLAGLISVGAIARRRRSQR